MKRNLTSIILVICFIALQVYAKVDEQKEFEKTCNRFLEQKQFDRLIFLSKEFMVKNPRYAPAYRFFVLGHYLGKNNPVEVENFLKNLFSKKPTDAYVHYGLGYLYYLQGKLKISEKELRQSISLNSNIALAQNNMGAVLSKMGKLDEALVHIRKALQLEPDLIVAQKNLQIVLDKKNRPVVAESLEQLIEYISYAISNNDSKRLDQIKTMNSKLILGNKFLTIQWCSGILNLAVKKELSGQIKLGNNYIKIAQIVAEIYKNAANDMYLMDKAAIFSKWSKEEKEKYRDAGELYGRGKELRKRYKYDAAVDFYDKSLSLYHEIGYKEGEADSLQSLGNVHRMLSENEKARKRYEEGLVIFREIKDRLGEANSLRRLGDVHMRLDDYEKARKQYEEGLVIFREIKARLGEAKSLRSLGDVHRMLSEYEKARKRYEEGLIIFREIKHRLGEANSLQSLGDVHMRLSEYEKARKWYEEGLVIYREINARLGEANSLKSLGDMHMSLDDYEKARKRYEEGLIIFREIKHRLGEANSLLNLGDVHMSLDDYEKARKRYEEGLVIYREIKHRLGEANSLQSLGDVHRMLSENEKARKRYEEGLVIYREINARLGEANSLKSLGDVHRILSEYEKARKLYEQGLLLQKKIGDRHGMIWSYYRLGQTTEAIKNYTQAEENYINSIRTIEEVWEQMKVEEHKTLYFASKVRPYEALITLLFKLKKGEAAFPYAERSKSRAFLYILGNKRIDPKKGVPLKLVREEKELRKKITLITLKIRENEKRKKNRRVSSQKSKAELFQLKERHSEILQKIKRNSPEYASFLSVNPLPVEEIQALIRDEGNMVLIEYYTTKKATYIWLLDGKKIHPYKINITKRWLNNNIREFRTLLSNDAFGVETLTGRAQELYDLLLKPAAKHINGKSLIGIIPHGTLHYLPFESLMNNGKFLIEQDLKFFYLPSASTYKYCKEKNQLKKKKIIALGNPDGTLPNSEKEVEEIKRFFQRDSEIFIGKEAKESKVKDKKIAFSSDIFHFACHGTFNPEHPLYSYLKLAAGDNEDGNLETQEIFDLQLKPAYLVTLSACYTHIGGIKRGDEIIGLTRAFIYAGTSGILASLWKVDDYYTEKFMVAFYRALKTSDKIEALHKARQEMINTYGKKHPFYWSAFVLIGDPR